MATMQSVHAIEQELIEATLTTWHNMAAIAYATALRVIPFCPADRHAMLALRRVLLAVVRDMVALRGAIECRQSHYGAMQPRARSQGWVQNPIRRHAPLYGHHARAMGALSALYQEHIDALDNARAGVETVRTIVDLTAQAIRNVYPRRDLFAP